MIRKATIDDIEHIKAIGQRFYEGSVWAGVIPYDADYFGRFAGEMIANAGAVFVSDKGFCGGMMAPVYFNESAKVASELFWFTQGDDGEDLHKAFEIWARAQGAQIVHMTGQVNSREKGIRRLYQMRGYEAKEIGFFKEVA